MAQGRQRAAFPLSRFHSEPGIFIVIGDTVEKGDFGLADRLDARLFETGQRGGEGHVGVQHAGSARDQPMDRRVDAKGRALDLARAAHQAAVVTHFDQTARRDLGPVQSKRDLQIAIVGARHREGKVIEDHLAETLSIRKSMRCREVDARLPRC